MKSLTSGLISFLLVFAQVSRASELLVIENENSHECALNEGYGGDIIEDTPEQLLQADFMTYLHSNSKFKTGLVGAVYSRFLELCGNKPMTYQTWIFREDLSAEDFPPTYEESAVMVEITLACTTPDGRGLSGFFRVDRSRVDANCFAGSNVLHD